MLFNSDLLSRAFIVGSYYLQQTDYEQNKDVTVHRRSSCLAGRKARNRTGHFKPVHIVIYQPSQYALYRIHFPKSSFKYTIGSRISTTWGLCHSVDSMALHNYHRDHALNAAKGRRKEPVVATWSSLTNGPMDSPSKPTRRTSLSQSIFAQSQSSNSPLLTKDGPHHEKHSSNTWTSSSEHSHLLFGEEGKDDREHFFVEYNRLAQRHGLRPLIPGDFSNAANGAVDGRRDSWLSKMLRQAAEQSAQVDSEAHRLPLRNLSDTATNLVQSHKRDGLKDRDLTALVRLCGKSRLFLPKDYAPFSLTLPTCLRALAQALVQHADTKGIFRVPGSARVVNALYDYYCLDGNTDAVSSTTHCPTLPTHIRCNTHDIASTFKRLLAGLPGGILGSLSLFDALVSIYSQLQGDAELHRTKESKLRARLIALAIGTVESRYQRELICAVFGLLCLVGRIAENAPREDDNGRPLPTTDLMGYNSLGIVFGPLLVGDMIDNYSMKVADPSAGLILLPISPPRSRKERHKHKQKHGRKHRHRHKLENRHESIMTPSMSIDKIRVANSITEMLIVHWREVVRQIGNTGSVKNGRGSSSLLQRHDSARNSISSSVSEDLLLKNRPHLRHDGTRCVSPTTTNPTVSGMKPTGTPSEQNSASDPYTPHTRQASSISSSGSIQKQLTKAAPNSLSPMIEENPAPTFDVIKSTHNDEMPREQGGDDVTQLNHPISTRTNPSQVHDDSSSESVSRLEMIGKSVDSIDTTTLAAVPGIRQCETPPPSDRVLSTPSMELPTVQTTTRHRQNPVVLSTVPPQKTLPNDRSKGLDPIASKDDSLEICSEPIETAAKTVVTGKVSPSEPCANSDRDGDLRNHSFSLLNPNSNQHQGDNRIETLDSGYAHTRRLDKTNPRGEVLGNPIGQWRNLRASTKDSPESLFKSAKARRLKRSAIPVASSSSRDTSVLKGSESTLPERKQRSIQEGYGLKGKSTPSKPDFERHSNREDAPQSTHPLLDTHVKQYASNKFLGNASHRGVSQRSTSKPMPGAVKAMAALFDNAAKESPDSSVITLSGRTLHNPHEPSNLPCCDVLDGSPTKSKPCRGALTLTKSAIRLDEHYRQRPNHTSTPEKDSPVANYCVSTVRTAPTWLKGEHTPTNTMRSTLKPVKMFSSARNEPQILPTATIPDQPPRLGTIVPYDEEPPIGHFVRPNSATSAQSRSQTVNPEGLTSPLNNTESRQTSAGTSSVLHAQIRSLHRQLALKNEEILQLRRQLETQEHMDIGTLCEQLRFAKRECQTWRKRAEAAERRVAVFQRFGAKIRAVPDGAIEEDENDNGNYGELRNDGSSSYSPRTENRKSFNDRIRRSFAEKARTLGGGDGAVFGDYDGAPREVCAGSEYQLRSGRLPKTARLWEAAYEMFDPGHGDSTCITRREHSAW
ncbi:hypothetical protein F5B22DRAFT_350562 [Xylaria bambusicola]|uniref:uncharacterized protein n=1 Tax=Xylaria bambusicola TaxID=326684 RepID=UPI002007D4DC|nr:uncharacterized protein F5B22DRAFT_350562 [Xylaria bambusicola]KAI0525589.1 hypothetical protein F5B22DRAFT_350562 [Xylaria bambusicola]